MHIWKLTNHVGKFVLALRCLNVATSLAPDSPKVHEQTVAFRHALNSQTDLPSEVQQVLKEGFKSIEESVDLKKYNAEFQARHKSNPSHVLAAIRAKRNLGEDPRQCDKEITGILDIPSVSFTDAIEALETLKRWKSPEVGAFKAAALSKWPEVTRLS